MNRPLRILQVNTSDLVGGAARIALTLHSAYAEQGHDSWLAVSKRLTSGRNILSIPSTPTGLWPSFWRKAAAKLRTAGFKGAWRLMQLSEQLVDVRNEISRYLGIEEFSYPGTSNLLELPPLRPDILQCHNLHAGYFDLRKLSQLCRKLPLVLTLHDDWLMTGHCASSLDCNLWESGCGPCPYLNLYPAVRQDRTRFNWNRKRKIYNKSRFYLSTPSQWLMNRARRSILASSITEAQIIPNGVDLTRFRPGDKRKARSELGLPQDGRIVLFSAMGLRNNPFKDYETLEAAIRLTNDPDISLVAIGDLGPEPKHQRIGESQCFLIPYQKDPGIVLQYNQAADLYVQATLSDSFPNSILEALACGTPVVATAVGGIPEQIIDLSQTEQGKATGILVPARDPAAMAQAIRSILGDENLRKSMSENAARDASTRFDLRVQARSYLDWFSRILEQSNISSS